MELFWFIPTHGDGRHLATTVGARPTDYPYLRQIAQAIDELGFAGALLPTGKFCDDAWIVASTLAAVTTRMKFLVAIRPGLMSPTLAARMTATLDRLSNGRLLINVVTGGDPHELAGDGVHLEHDARYDLTDEFLTVWRGVLKGEHIDLDGEHLNIKDASLGIHSVQKPYPPLYFGGSSDAAHKIAAKHVDTYLTWGEPPQAVVEKIASVRKLAEAQGRTLRFGIRLHVIVRETRQEAWDAAESLIKYVDDNAIAAAQQLYARMDSVGQQRMAALHNGSRSALEISPDLWAGVGLVRGGAGTALVGDPDTIAARMREYAEVGVETFIMSGYPHLEEAYRVAELLFPRLPLNHVPAVSQARLSGPFGEIVPGYSNTAPKAASVRTSPN